MSSDRIRRNLSATNRALQMWCTECKQDVPAIATQDETEQVVCARCGLELVQVAVNTEPNSIRFDQAHMGSASRPTDESPPPAGQPTNPSDPSESEWIDHDDATSVEDIMRANVAIHAYRTTSENGVKITEKMPRRQLPTNAVGPTSLVFQQPRRFQIPVAWCVVCVGMTLLAFGGFLVGWSMAVERPDLGRIGVPTFFVGQGVLVLGLLFQLERLLQSHRKTETALRQLHETTGRLARDASIREQLELVQ